MVSEGYNLHDNIVEPLTTAVLVLVQGYIYYIIIGLNKHFHMVCIQHKLQQSTGLPVSAGQIWSHLRGLYEIDSLVNDIIKIGGMVSQLLI